MAAGGCCAPVSDDLGDASEPLVQAISVMRAVSAIPIWRASASRARRSAHNLERTVPDSWELQSLSAYRGNVSCWWASTSWRGSLGRASAVCISPPTQAQAPRESCSKRSLQRPHRSVRNNAGKLRTEPPSNGYWSVSFRTWRRVSPTNGGSLLVQRSAAPRRRGALTGFCALQHLHARKDTRFGKIRWKKGWRTCRLNPPDGTETDWRPRIRRVYRALVRRRPRHRPHHRLHPRRPCP